MKRIHRAREIFLKKTYPLFTWRKCVACHHDFRREKGWKFEANKDIKLICYICETCGTSENRAYDLAVKHIVENQRELDDLTAKYKKTFGDDDDWKTNYAPTMWYSETRYVPAGGSGEPPVRMPPHPPKGKPNLTLVK